MALQQPPAYVPDLFFERCAPQHAEAVKRIVESIRCYMGRSRGNVEFEARMGSFHDGQFSSDIGVDRFQRLNAAMNWRCENSYMPPVEHTRHDVVVDHFFKGPRRLRYTCEKDGGQPLRLVEKQATGYVDMPALHGHAAPGMRVCFSTEDRLDMRGFTSPGEPTTTREKERVSYTLGWWMLDLTKVVSGDATTYEAELEFRQPDVAHAACHDFERGEERLRLIAISLLNNLQTVAHIVAGGGSGP